MVQPRHDIGKWRVLPFLLKTLDNLAYLVSAEAEPGQLRPMEFDIVFGQGFQPGFVFFQRRRDREILSIFLF